MLSLPGKIDQSYFTSNPVVTRFLKTYSFELSLMIRNILRLEQLWHYVIECVKLCTVIEHVTLFN